MSNTYESILDSAIYSGLSQLQHLSNTELNALLEDNAKLEDLVKDLPHVSLSPISVYFKLKSTCCYCR